MSEAFRVVDEAGGDATADDSVEGFTALARLRQIIAEQREAQAPTVTIRLARFERMEATYRVPDSLAIERSVSDAKKHKSLGPEADKLLLLARCCVGLKIDSEPLTEDDGSPSTFASRTVRALAEDAPSAAAAVDWFYRGGRRDGPDGDVVSHALALIRAAGYGAEPDIDDEPDPTRGR